MNLIIRLKNLSLLLLLWLYASASHASLLQYFKDDNGDTKWQYVANFSSGVLIILLSLVTINLLISHRRAQMANRALEKIRDELEQRVQERTATLDDYNKLLKETNHLLEGEISQHRQTTSRLQSSEAYINCILESMPLILIGLDKNNLITHWNKPARLYTGIDCESAIGHNLWEIYPAIPLAAQQLAEVIQSDKPTIIKHCQRGQFYYEIIIYPLRGTIDLGVVIMIDDVTQRKLSENQLIQRDKMSSMGELASAMAHDIEMPLKQMLQHISSVQESLHTIEYHRGTDVDQPAFQQELILLTEAGEKGKQATEIINNILDFAREYGDTKRFINIPELLDHSLEMAGNLISKPSGLRFKDIAVEKSYADDLPNIAGYVSELQYVFLSLLRHSLHAMGRVKRDNYTPAIKLELAFHYEALWIKIHHNGVGLTGEEQNTIFEPYYIDNSIVTPQEPGQRLSFTYFIITEHHKGQIAVTSDINIGTTFHIQLQL